MSTEYENIKTSGILLNRFYGGESRGVCLQISKSNSWKGEYKHFTLQGAKQLQDKLTVLQVNNKEDVFFKIAEGFYLNITQCIDLSNDINLFINDEIHIK